MPNIIYGCLNLFNLFKLSQVIKILYTFENNMNLANRVDISARSTLNREFPINNFVIGFQTLCAGAERWLKLFAIFAASHKYFGHDLIDLGYYFTLNEGIKSIKNNPLRIPQNPGHDFSWQIKSISLFFWVNSFRLPTVVLNKLIS